MQNDLLRKGISLLLKQQTNILSAAFVLMITVMISYILGLVKLRLLGSIFGLSDVVGIYITASKLPDFLFQIIISSALSTAFIPVFSDYLAKGRKEEAHQMASSLLMIGMVIFLILAVVLSLFAPFFLQFFNLGGGFSPDQLVLMTNLLRIILIGQVLFIVGTFFTALLQSYNHFFIPGLAAALYNLGIILGLIFFAPMFGIYSAAIGVIIGAFFFVIVQLPLIHKTGFRFRPILKIRNPGVIAVGKLMGPRTIFSFISQFGGIIAVAFLSFLQSAGRSVAIFDYAQTLAFVPIALFGQTIAQAAFPVLSREKDNLEKFKQTFLTSFNQMLYVILPITVLLLVLRIPIVRLVFGADKVDWQATLLTGRTLAYFSVFICSQALIALVSRAFYALHNSKIPLIVGGISTGIMIILAYFFIVVNRFGVESLALAYSLANLTQFTILFYLLHRMTGGFDKKTVFISLVKFFITTFITGLALYTPFKLLDDVIINTTRTVGLLLITGISTLAGLSMYLLLSWVFKVKEATTYILLFKKVGNWREILNKSDEVIDGTRFNP